MYPENQLTAADHCGMVSVTSSNRKAAGLETFNRRMALLTACHAPTTSRAIASGGDGDRSPSRIGPLPRHPSRSRRKARYAPSTTVTM